MSIKSILNAYVQRNRDAATLSVYETRALTNFYEACHGDFAYLPEQSTLSANGFAEDYPQDHKVWKAALAQ